MWKRGSKVSAELRKLGVPYRAAAGAAKKPAPLMAQCYDARGKAHSPFRCWDCMGMPGPAG